MATKEPEGKMVVGENEPKAPRIELEYRTFNKKLEKQYLPAIRALIAKDLSEPYSIYVYRYFLYEWADLCWMVRFPLAQDFTARPCCTLQGDSFISDCQLTFTSGYPS